jgi:hypothetical protein
VVNGTVAPRPKALDAQAATKSAAFVQRADRAIPQVDADPAIQQAQFLPYETKRVWLHTSMPPRTLLLFIAAVALGASCDRTPPTAAPPTSAPPAPPPAAAPIVDAAAAPAATATPVTAPDFDPGNGSNAFSRQKPVIGPRAAKKTTRRDRFVTVVATPDEVARFLDDLKTHLQKDDREAIAGTMNYPLVVAVGDGNMAIGDGTQFLAHYDNVMTAPVVGAIGKANAQNVRVPKQGVTLGSDANHLENYLGVAIGDDRIWFDMVEVEGKRRLLIRMVNATRSK